MSEWYVFFLNCVFSVRTCIQNPAYGRHRISWPMRIKAPMFFFLDFFLYSILNNSLFLRLYESVHKCTSWTPLTHGPFMGAIWNNSLFLGLYETVDDCTSPLLEHLPNVANLCMQSRTTFFVFRALQVGWLVHQSTRQTPPTRGRSMYAIRNNSLSLGLFRVSWQDSSESPRVDDPWRQSGITPCF